MLKRFKPEKEPDGRFLYFITHLHIYSCHVFKLARRVSDINMP